VWIDVPERLCYSVVLPEPDHVHGEEAQLFVSADVAGEKAADAGLTRVAPAVHRVGVVEGQQRQRPVVVGESFSQAPKVVGEIAQGVGQIAAASVHLGRVDEGGELVDLLPLLQPLKEDGGGAGAAGGAAPRELYAAVL